MAFDIKIDLDTHALKKLGEDIQRLSEDETAGNQLAILARNLMDEYVPFDTGRLASTVKIEPWKLTYSREGLLRNYKGVTGSGTIINYTKEHHPNATHHWDDAMLTNKGEQFREQSAQILMERLRRINGNG